MKNVFYLVEQATFLIAWELLYKRIFPQQKLQRKILGITYSALVLIFAGMLGQTISRQLGPLIGIGLSSGIVFAFSKGQRPTGIIEKLVTYVMTKTIWLLSVLMGFSLSRSLGRIDALDESLLVCSVQVCITLVINKFIQEEWWEGIVEKYSMQIVILLSTLFIVSHSIVLIPYNQEKWEIHLYAFIIAIITTTILLIWVFNDLKYRKELEAKTKHINDLVRGAHRYKEIIPAVSRELRKLAQEMGGEVSSELSIAIEEVDQLWNMTARQDREERKKAPNLNQTGLPLLDGQLEQEWREADAAGVSFECVAISPVGELAERVELFHLMQLVGDLFRNALRAIQRSGGENGRILLFLGKRREGYEIKMRDTGAPFPKEVLERLGERGLTTGGTGHGMADMLETLARYRASLEIQEEMETTAFTKTVSLLFDNEAMVRVNCPAQSIVYERHLPELTKI